MICFQKFFLQYLSQPTEWFFLSSIGCDLLSKVLFTIFVTARRTIWSDSHLLWFAFKSSFYNICHSFFSSFDLIIFVVICFQKFFLQYLSQPFSLYSSLSSCCDLLSKVLFTIFVTAFFLIHTPPTSLWFAFKSSFYNICHSLYYNQHNLHAVVICFQKFFLQYLSQLSWVYSQIVSSCDLLSKVLFTIFVTA